MSDIRNKIDRILQILFMSVIHEMLSSIGTDPASLDEAIQKYNENFDIILAQARMISYPNALDKILEPVSSFDWVEKSREFFKASRSFLQKMEDQYPPSYIKKDFEGKCAWSLLKCPDVPISVKMLFHAENINRLFGESVINIYSKVCSIQINAIQYSKFKDWMKKYSYDRVVLSKWNFDQMITSAAVRQEREHSLYDSDPEDW